MHKHMTMMEKIAIVANARHEVERAKLWICDDEFWSQEEHNFELAVTCLDKVKESLQKEWREE